MPRLFQAFEQGERAITRRFGGLGLGLTISKALLDAHGGRIGVVSAGKNKGTTFSVTLHTVADAPATATATHAPAQSDAEQSRPRKILLVEDHLDTSRILSRLLSSVGHDVKTAASVSEALKAAEREPFDLVISDIGLPDGSGLDLMRQLNELRPMQGIALSGFGMDTDVARSREAGFAEHLIKPINFQQLASVIERLSVESS
jgi:CheY-like chemotaxis protein